MRALTAGLRLVGVCVSRRLPRRAPAGLPQNKESPTKLQGEALLHEDPAGVGRFDPHFS